MNQIEKINFRQARDFGETFNASIKFIRQNFKHFFLTIISIAGPFILIAAISGAFYQSNSIGAISFTKMRQDDFFAQYGISLIIFLLASIVSSIALIGTTYAYMINYLEKGPNNFTTGDVGNLLLKKSGKIIIAFFAMILFMIIAVAIMAGIGALFAAVNSSVLVVLYILLLVFGLIIVMPPFMWQMSAINMIVMQEEKGPFEAFRKTFTVMRGNFWWTWVIMVCAVIAIAIAGLVFTLPQVIYQMFLMFSHLKPGAAGVEEGTSIPFIIVATVCTFFSTTIYAAMHVICGIHYFSLAEQKDGTGLMERIDEIGNTPTTNAEQYY